MNAPTLYAAAPELPPALCSAAGAVRRARNELRRAQEQGRDVVLLGTTQRHGQWEWYRCAPNADGHRAALRDVSDAVARGDLAVLATRIGGRARLAVSSRSITWQEQCP